MEIADGVFTYRGRPGDKIRPGAGSSSVTVVRGDRLVMIDTGVVPGGAFDELARGMKADGLDIGDVGLVLFTHAHWDHLNAARKVVARSGADIASGTGEAPFIEDSRKNFDAFVPGFAEFVKEIFPFPMFVARLLLLYAWGLQPDLAVGRKLSDGDAVDFGREIRAVSLPGHTDGHTGFFIPDVRALVTGDLVDFENSEGMDLNNPRSSYRSAVDSIKRALPLEADTLIPGHGEPVVGRQKVRAVLGKALEGGLQYPAMIKRALGTKPHRLNDILTSVFPDTPFSTRAMRMMLLLVVLLDLEKTGEVTRVVAGGRPAWVAGDTRK